MLLPSALWQIALSSLRGSENPWEEVNLPKVSHFFHRETVNEQTHK